MASIRTQPHTIEVVAPIRKFGFRGSPPVPEHWLCRLGAAAPLLHNVCENVKLASIGERSRFYAIPKNNWPTIGQLPTIAASVYATEALKCKDMQ